MSFPLLKPRFLAGVLLASMTLALAAQEPPSDPKIKKRKLPPKPAAKHAVAPRPDPSTLIDVNTASRQDLMKLPGVDRPTADQIIAGRPYVSKAKLVTKAAIPAGLFQVIRNLIVVRFPVAPKP
jgi:DNA uptake protein ComE-like DNA-binding protein